MIKVDCKNNGVHSLKMPHFIGKIQYRSKYDILDYSNIPLSSGCEMLIKYVI